MARRNSNSVGRPFVATPSIAVGISNFDSLQSGQWVRILGQKRAARFVRERETGRNLLVEAPKGSRLSVAAFRLAVGNDAANVVRLVK